MGSEAASARRAPGGAPGPSATPLAARGRAERQRARAAAAHGRAPGRPSATSARRRSGAASRSPSWSSSLGIVADGLGLPLRRRRRAARIAAGLALASLGGLELAVREHVTGFRSHTTLLAGRAGDRGRSPCSRSASGRVNLLAAAADRGWRSSPAPSTGCASCSSGAPAGWASVSVPAVSNRPAAHRGPAPRDADLPDLERSVAFYRNLLGMRMVKQTVNEDDRGARHLFFGDEEGRPGTLVTCLEYPQLEEGKVGRRLDPPLRAGRRVRGGAGGLARLPGAHGVPCTEVHGPHLLQVALPARSRRPHRGAGHDGPRLTVDDRSRSSARRPIGRARRELPSGSGA